MEPSLESLRCFTEAARALNFRAAARVVALSPAALGQRIKLLEAELGAPLFTRTTRSVALTEAGLRLLPHAERTLAAAVDCRRVARGELGEPPVELVLGTRHELGLSWVVPLVDELERARPGLTLHLYFGSGPDLVSRVRGRLLDCAVTSTRVVDPKLDFLRLHEERYVFVGAASLLARAPLRTPKDAARHTLLDTSEELPLFRYWRDAEGAFDSLRFERVIRLGSIAAIRARVLRGRGVAVLPLYFVERDLAARRMVRVVPKVRPASDVFRLIFRADDPLRGTYERLAEVMLANPLR